MKHLSLGLLAATALLLGACDIFTDSDGDGECNAIAKCAPGYIWSESACACVPEGGTVGSECVTDADCKITSNYCDGCSCTAMPTKASLPKCTGNTVQCFSDPCRGRAAACVSGFCKATFQNPRN
jgi:hypothetical protein